MEPLLESYNNTVPTTNIDEMCTSVMRWLDQNCNLTNLRRGEQLRQKNAPKPNSLLMDMVLF